MSFDKTIQMYIFDGNPNGRIMCELSNWNGRVYKISRNELSQFANGQMPKIPASTFFLARMKTMSMLYISEKAKKY